MTMCKDNQQRAPDPPRDHGGSKRNFICIDNILTMKPNSHRKISGVESLETGYFFDFIWMLRLVVCMYALGEARGGLKGGERDGWMDSNSLELQREGMDSLKGGRGAFFYYYFTRLGLRVCILRKLAR